MIETEKRYGIEREFTFHDSHRALLRELHLTWDSAESGAPVVDSQSPFGVQEEKDTGVKILRKAGIKTTPAKADMLISQVPVAFQIFVSYGKLEPGTYAVKNNLTPKGKKIRLESFTGQNIFVPKEDALNVEVTKDHLKLLRYSNTRWSCSLDTTGVNPKRPYGDMASYFIDMREILGTKDNAVKLKKLHVQMLLVLLTFLQHAELTEGRYAMLRPPRKLGAA